MFTKTCTLTFPNGDVVTAAVTAATPYDQPEVSYAGATFRLPTPLEKNADPALLETHFSNLAEDLHATLSTTEEGLYETWAE